MCWISFYAFQLIFEDNEGLVKFQKASLGMKVVDLFVELVETDDFQLQENIYRLLGTALIIVVSI